MANNTITMISKLQYRRDSAANWATANPILAAGEPGYETDTRKFKIGDGVTYWNTLPYNEATLFAATATELGGIIASSKSAADTVEAKIDPVTHKVYVPTYPAVPSLPDLAAVATSGKYGDLSEKPAPYALPAATVLALGGIKALPKTASDTVEVKIDPQSSKLFVPSGGSAPAGETEDHIPQIQFRCVPHIHSSSPIFTNEPEKVISGDIYFRPMCSNEYFNRIKDSLCVGLTRYNTRKKNRIIGEVGSGVSSRQKSVHIVGASPWHDTPIASRYPNTRTFSDSFFGNFAEWTAVEPTPVTMNSLIPGIYHGGWIKFPYSLEVITRRFIYISEKNPNTKMIEILPISSIRRCGVFMWAKLKVSGSQNSTKMYVEGMSFYYASVNLGLALCKHIVEPSNFKHWRMGPITEFRAIINMAKNGCNQYAVQAYHCRRKR